MSDPTNVVQSKGGLARASFSGLYTAACLHLTPPMVGYLCTRWPIIGEQLSFEIVVALESVFGAFVVKLTPSHVVQSVTDGIIFVRTTWKTWRDAANKNIGE